MVFLRTVSWSQSFYRLSELPAREGDWGLHLSSIRSLLPWCFEYYNINYQRYLSAYLSDTWATNIRMFFSIWSQEGLVCKLERKNPFGRILVDQACEETVNKDTQTAGETKWFSLKLMAISKYYLVGEYRSLSAVFWISIFMITFRSRVNKSPKTCFWRKSLREIQRRKTRD